MSTPAVATVRSFRDQPAQSSVALVGGSERDRVEISELLLTDGGFVVEAVATALDEFDDGLVEHVDALILLCERDLAGEVLKRVAVLCPPGRMIVVTELGGGRTTVRRALNAGAAGFVWATEVNEALAPTVKAVCAGQLAIPLAQREEFERTALTTREKQILGLVVMGLRNGEIAQKLYLAESTVKSHLSSGFNKLGVRSRNEATAVILDPASEVGPGILGLPLVDKGA